MPGYAPDPERDGHVSQQSWIGICFFNALIVINQTCLFDIFSQKKSKSLWKIRRNGKKCVKEGKHSSVG